jgi:FtsZ-binding cell division protein ZapB
MRYEIMDKKIIGLLITIIIATVTISGCIGEDVFAESMKEAGNANADEVSISNDLDDSLNDFSKVGIEKNINLTTQSIKLLEKIDDSFNNALTSTDNETIKKYLKLAIELNQLEIDEMKNKQKILKAQQDYDNGKISLNEYNKLFDEYQKNYDNYIKNIENVTKKINNVLKDDPVFVEELKSYGFGGGLYLGEFLSHSDLD